MGGLGLFRMRWGIVRAAMFGCVARLVVMVAIGLDIRRPRLLLVALGWRALRLLLIHIVRRFVLPCLSLSLRSLPSVQGPRLTIDTEVGEIISRSYLDHAVIEALDVLPRIALFAVYRRTVVVCEIAYALDRVRLFIDGLGRSHGVFWCMRGSNMVGRRGRRRNLRW